jgi:hypothetical protein
VVAPELLWAGQWELEPQDTWWPRSCPGLAVGAGAAGHVAAPGWQWKLEPQGTWRPRSCPELAVRAGAAGHVAAPKPTSAGRRDPELQLM